MDSSESVTRWIRGITANDPAAAELLWGRYFGKLVQLARKRLGSLPRRVADEEDVALSAFHSFCRAAREGRFPRLGSRDDLWRLLLSITSRKAVDLIRYHARGHRRVLGESALGPPDGEGSGHVLDRVIGPSPSPEFAAQVADECRHLLEVLGEPGLRDLAVLKLEGRTNREISRDRGCSVRTVERQLYLIRRKWEAESGGRPGSPRFRR